MNQANGSGGEAWDMARAATLAKLGAPLSLMESETRLPRKRLLRLYRQIHKKAPPAELSSIPADWFMRWQPNTHASMFLNIYDCLGGASRLDELDVLLWSYQLYAEQLKVLDLPEVLSINHAWRLIKCVDSGVLMLRPCVRCEGSFVVDRLDLLENFVCLLCQTPERVANSADVQGCAHADRLC